MIRHSRNPEGAPQCSSTARLVRLLFVSALLSALVPMVSLSVAAQGVPSPESVLGFRPTDDRTIADWTQIRDYFAKLDAASGRVKVSEIGKTTLGKPQIVAFISSEENIKNLERYRTISEAVATSPPGAKVDFTNGKAIVAISCSIHSTEIVASQMSMLLAHELATANDDGTKDILDNTILLLIPSANPDGIDIVADWYRKTLGTKYEGSSPPELYHHYAGHDNNRDWFMLNLEETRNITKLFWQEWFPQIVFDVHQQGQNGARMTVPPFFDPPNPRIDPVILRELGLLGYKIAADLQASGQAGIVSNATYDTWWHGGFRSAPYYHNSIGILTEAASAELMSPITITKQQLESQRPTRGLKSPLETSTNNPDAWQGGDWRPADIARTEMIAARGVLEMAAKFRSRYLANMFNLSRKNQSSDANEPQAFVVLAGQPHEERVARFLDILKWQGIEIWEMTEEINATTEKGSEDFSEIPGGSFYIPVTQAQKNNVLSLFEQQIYPERLNANGEAEVPYDVAGWTLPIQMGVEYKAVWKTKEMPVPGEGIRMVMNADEIRARLNLKPAGKHFPQISNPLKKPAKIGLYSPHMQSMDEGWTRLVLDGHGIKYSRLGDDSFRNGRPDSDVIILPSMSENSIVSGLSSSRYPEELSGGMTEAGVENLKKFVEDGGRLVCFDDSCAMVIKRFELPIKDTVRGLSSSEFYCPGSILALEVNTSDPVARGLNRRTPAYFTRSSAFEFEESDDLKSVARYAEIDLLLSGWILGEKHISGKSAIARAKYGKGEIVLFAFRPQHRGQSFATFPFVFNALEKK